MSRVTRRDRLHAAAMRAIKLDQEQAAIAWYAMVGDIELLGLRDLPKFEDVYRAFRRATIHARKTRSQVYKEVVARVSNMTAEEGFKSLVKAGIYNEDGTLSKAYGGDH